MVYLQAVVRDDSPAAACLRLAENQFIELFVSRQILDELGDVFSRSEIQRRFSKLTNERITAFSETLRVSSTIIKEVPRRFIYERDVGDEPYINLAIEVRADYLVSRDRDLLDLVSWNRQAGRDFQKRYRWLKILNPTDFLELLERQLPRSI